MVGKLLLFDYLDPQDEIDFCFFVVAASIWYCERQICSIHNILSKSPPKKKVREKGNRIIIINEN